MTEHLSSYRGQPTLQLFPLGKPNSHVDKLVQQNNHHLRLRADIFQKQGVGKIDYDTSYDDSSIVNNKIEKKKTVKKDNDMKTFDDSHDEEPDIKTEANVNSDNVNNQKNETIHPQSKLVYGSLYDPAFDMGD